MIDYSYMDRFLDLKEEFTKVIHSFYDELWKLALIQLHWHRENGYQEWP